MTTLPLEFLARLERDVEDTVGVEHRGRVRVLADQLAGCDLLTLDSALADGGAGQTVP